MFEGTVKDRRFHFLRQTIAFVFVELSVVPWKLSHGNGRWKKSTIFLALVFGSVLIVLIPGHLCITFFFLSGVFYLKFKLSGFSS